jgi:hypothetical protein
MNYHRLNQGAEWAVLAAVVVLHCLIVAPARSANDAAWLHIAGETQPVAMLVLLLAWGAFGPGRLAWRLILVPLSLTGLAIYLSSRLGNGWNGYASGLTVGFPYSLAIAALVMLAGVRILGIRLTSLAAGRSEPRPQFSIRTLLVVTTIVAIAIGCLEMLRPTVLTVSPDSEYADVVAWLEGQLAITRLAAHTRQWILSAALAGLAIASVVGVLRPGPVALRLAVLVLAVPAIGVYLTHFSGESANQFLSRAVEMTAALAAPALLVAITVLPLRLMGYRLCKAAASDRARASVPHAHAHARVERATLQESTT